MKFGRRDLEKSVPKTTRSGCKTAVVRMSIESYRDCMSGGGSAFYAALAKCLISLLVRTSKL